MTKAIKFNLLLDKHPVRDLEDLLAHFNLDDLLTAYHSHTLHRWLEVRGLTEELNQLMAINSADELGIASALCELFQKKISEADIETAVYPLKFRGQQQQQLEKLASQQFKKEAVINSYHAGYEQLCEDMLEKADDHPFLKAAVNILWADYAQLFSVDFDLFFTVFIEVSPLTLFTMLANDNYQQSGLFKPKQKESLFSHIPSSYSGEEKEGETRKYQDNNSGNWARITSQKVIIKRVINNSGKATIKGHDGKEYQGQQGLGKTLDGLYFFSYNSSDAVEYAIITPEKSNIPLLPPYQSYTGITDGYWKDLQPKGKKCLILSMEQGNLIRNSNKTGEELNAESVNKEFLILDGIDYKSNNADRALIYMVI